jgi:mannose-6-phosphate isomerase
MGMKDIIFLEPIFKSMIWGGNKLATEFGYSLPNASVGECWAISAHQKGDCRIKNGQYKGYTLSWLWDNHRELFGNASGSVFPLLIKIIDAKEDLSIQVHPDDAYAGEHEQGALGKTECWYVLACEEDTGIVIGHNARDKEELIRMIQENKWEELIRVLPIKKGDFFQIEPGTVHAIKKGTLILETQQNSDLTYRLYDYDRLDHGKPRELHLEKSVDVIRCPHKSSTHPGSLKKGDQYDIQELISCSYYNVTRIQMHGEQDFDQEFQFLNVSVIEGDGFINQYPIKKGDHFILPFGFGSYQFKGWMELIVSHI